MALADSLAAHTRRGSPPRRLTQRTGAAGGERQQRPAAIATDIISRVETMDSAAEASRTRGNAYLHVSALLGVGCVRSLILQQLSETPLTKRVFPAQRIVWALGRAAEHHVRYQYIESVKYSGVFGRWVCPCGNHETEPFYAPERECRQCGKPAFMYRELTLLDHDVRIVGSPDLVVAGADDLIVPVEIKSMNLTEFKERGGEDKRADFKPRPEHVGQVACYHKMLGQRFSAERMATYSLVFYVCKDHPKFGVSPYRTAFVAMNNPAVIRVQEQVWATARELWEARSNNSLPDRLPVCAKATSTTAKNCGVVGPCFSCR